MILKMLWQGALAAVLIGAAAIAWQAWRQDKPAAAVAQTWLADSGHHGAGHHGRDHDDDDD